MIILFGVILIIAAIVLLVLAIKEHRKILHDKPLDDSNWQIDFEDLHNKLRKFVSNKEEKIFAVLGIKNAYNLLSGGIQENGFCILTDKAAYFIGKVYQKKWIFAFRTNIQHRIIANEMKGIKVGTLSRFRMLFFAVLSILLEIANLQCAYRSMRVVDGSEYEAIFVLLIPGMLGAIVICFILVIYFVLHAFFLKRTNICIEFTSLTVAFLASELGRQEIKDFYKAVSEVQELYVNVANSIPAEHTVNAAGQSTNVYTNKVTSLSELSKLYENGMLTKEEFEQLKQEIIGSQ